MESVFGMFSDWESSLRAADDAKERAVAAAQAADERSAVIADLLRKHGPITHNNHVYWLCNGSVFRSKCVASFSLELEAKK